jgi:hypothetical protein
VKINTKANSVRHIDKLKANVNISELLQLMT